MSANVKAALQGLIYGAVAGIACSALLWFIILPAMVKP
jgi:hypothetical protein